ncbi:MAG: rhomboid family intramembrane serine protease [Chloroflexi bacterium]|nr:rhomboid family intramembrane serine protease [Chloroflexota bacterium]
MIPIRDTIPSRRLPLVTWLLLGLNLAVFLYELSLGPGLLNEFIGQYALVPARLAGDPLAFGFSLLTSQFLHAGWFHFLSNMWVLYIFGDNVEDRMSPARFLGFYLLSGAAAGLLQASFSPGSSVPVLGASGAIAGVLGAYMLFYPSARVLTLVPLFFLWFVEVPAVIFLGLWFVLQLLSGLGAAAAPGVAWWAHVGGFLFGLVAANLFAVRRRARWQAETGWLEDDF